MRVEGLLGELLTLTEDIDHIRATPTTRPRTAARFGDPGLKGHFATRDRYRNAAHHAQVFNMIGEVRAVVTLAGRIVGTWAWDKGTRTVYTAS
ncbi:hypothetical protein [Streptomyces rimosus]|uniref:hypothetical protein n=1 Tax=Streptomyces rimosus TaxID=1927 RepID=UPI0004C9CCEF|nr:hypothetical protein [Streptomyces rimosus]